MQIMRNKVVIILLLTLAASAFSCSRYYGITLHFAEKSAVIPHEELLRFGHWAKETQVRYPDSQAIVVEAGVETTEENWQHFGRMRERAARLALIDFDILSKDVYTSERILRSRPENYTQENKNDGRTAGIQYIGSHPDFTRPCFK